jgi:benzoyl-CoA reductase subunit C
MITNRINENVPQKVSYACSYVPEEIILAVGLIPKRIIPMPRPSEADAYMHPNTCHYVKSLLASGLGGDASGTDGIVFANSCDGMRRLHDLWNEYVTAVPALFVDVPKKNDPASIEFFAAELRRFADNLERTVPGSPVSDKRLEEAIGACNNVRRLMGEVFTLQRTTDSGMTGLSVLELCLDGARSHPAEFSEKLKEIIADSQGRKPSGNGPRVVLTGNVIHRPDSLRYACQGEFAGPHAGACREVLDEIFMRQDGGNRGAISTPQTPRGRMQCRRYHLQLGEVL